MDPEEIKKRLAQLGWWYHNVDLGMGIRTNPDDSRAYDPRTRWHLIDPYVPDDLSGKSVLDLGCACGYFSVMMKKRGADYVLGVDASDRSIGQARFLAELHNVDVDFRLEDVYRFCLNNREVFDYVLFMGLFYHLRHPLLVLDHVAAVTRELMYFQCEVRGPRCLGKLTVQDDYAYDENAVFRHEEFPKMFFIEKLYNSDPSNWWLPNEAGLLAVVRSAGFEIVGQPSREILVCKPGRRPVWVDICDHVSIPLVVKRVAYQ